jgi:predicted DNA-binding transcriptional regulator YafY
MTFAVADVTEVVRWAMGFGADAKIVAPPKAIEAALVMAKRIASAYDEPTSLERTAALR